MGALVDGGGLWDIQLANSIFHGNEAVSVGGLHCECNREYGSTKRTLTSPNQKSQAVITPAADGKSSAVAANRSQGPSRKIVLLIQALDARRIDRQEAPVLLTQGDPPL